MTTAAAPRLSRFTAARLLVLVPFFAAMILIAGCGGGSKGPKDSVSGKVTLEDKPVAGEVAFTFSDGKELKTPIGLDGFYQIANPPKGEVKITVKSMMVGSAGKMKDDMKAPESSGVPPPAKYARPESSGLTYTIKGGDEKFDIKLTP